MARALISGITQQLGSFIASEFTLTASVKEEIQKLESKFRTIQAVLNDAEKRQVKEEAVKLWLDKLKDVSYEMDDVLDEWNTAMIKADIAKEEEAETSTAKKRKVQPLIPNINFSILQHRDIAHKIKELNEKLGEIVREREMYGFELTTRGNASEVVERPKTTSFVDVSEICGRDNVQSDLVSILLGKGSEEERSPHVISLVGMGGIGKTTLAQLAYNDSKVKAHFEKRMWVCVSEPFDQCRVAKAILEALGGDRSNSTELQSLLENIYELIRGMKLFLVLDDVWTEDSTLWEPFRLAFKYGAQGSRILVTTRKSSVAWMMGSTSACMINLEVLSDKDCWLVFSKIAFFDKDPEQCKQLEDLGRKITKKCKGLPLAAKTLGSLMRFKRSRKQWKKVLNNNLWELEDLENGLFAPLLLSYYDLPSPLKQCFSYCAVFPKDYVFSIDDLVLRWMAQGYIESKANMEIEIMAREYFDILAIRSFFQDFEKHKHDDKIKRCLRSLTLKCLDGMTTQLPNAIGTFIHLSSHIEFPRGIQRLTSLRRLSYFSKSYKDDSKGCNLGELKNLNQLQGSLEIRGLGKVVDVCEAKNALLKKKIYLRRLDLLFDGEYEEEMENDALEKLEHLPPLGKLPFLERLDILTVNSLKKVGVEFLGIESENKREDIIFPNLKSLGFENLFMWEEWIGIGGIREEVEDSTITIMPRLQELQIESCPKLKSLPTFLHTTPLKDLDIKCSPILSERCRRGTGEEWSKISNIPDIQIDRMYVQIDGEEVNYSETDDDEEDEYAEEDYDEENDDEEEFAAEEFDEDDKGL
uniref:NB-ARC domain-containing protein n=1 Tax=Fagus sylvatica TaxID=28930 RepID=A0A2N9IPW8_FAGSY